MLQIFKNLGILNINKAKWYKKKALADVNKIALAA